MITLPTAPEAEQALLGCLFLDSSGLGKVRNLIPVEAFYSESNRLVYKAILAVYDTGEAVDLVTVTEALRLWKELEQIGGPIYLVGLADSSGVSWHVESYARIVLEAFQRRRLIAVGQELIQSSIKSQDAPEKIWETISTKGVEAARLAIGRSEQKQLREDIALALGVAEGSYLLSTGFPTLDKVFGGFPPDLSIIAASNSNLKSGLMYSLAKSIAKLNYDSDSKTGFVGIVSPDQPRALILAKEAAKRSGVSTGDLGRVNDMGYKLASQSQKERFRKGMNSVVKDFLHHVRIKDGSVTLTKLRTVCMRWIEKGASCLFLDALQNLTIDPKLGELGTLEAALSTLKGMASDYKIPIVCLSQVQASVEDNPYSNAYPGKRPDKINISKCRRTANDLANMILMLYYPEKYSPTNQEIVPLELFVAKNKGGAAGSWNQRDTIRLKVHKEFAHVYDPKWKVGGRIAKYQPSQDVQQKILKLGA